MQEPLGHLHDLLFVRFAVAGHRQFHLHGGVLEDGHPKLFCRQQDDPAAMRHGDAGGQIGIKKQLLHRHLVRMKGVDQLLHILIDHSQPMGQRQPRRGGEDTILDDTTLAPVGFHDAKPNGGNPWVDAQDDHVRPSFSFK